LHKQLLAVLSALACVPALPGSQQQLVDPGLQFEELVAGLDEPTTMAFIGPDDLLILQKKDGRVLRVLDGQMQGAVLDVAVKYEAERGMLGIATDPDFVNSGHVYLFYTESATGTDVNDGSDPLGHRLYRYTWNGAALVDPSLVAELPIGFGVHSGGILTFGPDDKLYLIVGDLSHGNVDYLAGRLQNNADGEVANDAGVIFRFNVDGTAPRDNPFYDAADPGNPWERYFAYGIRNSFGMAFDPRTGNLWETENGPTSYDEINRAAPGMNGGHFRIWGPEASDAEGQSDLWVQPGSAYSDPEFSWLLPPALTSVAFVESRKLGCDREHDLLVGAYGCRAIYHFELDAQRESLVFASSELQDLVADNSTVACEQEQAEILFASGPQWNSDSTTDIKNGPDGLIYLLSYSHGTLRRIVPVPGAVPDTDADQVADACDCDAADPTAYAPTIEVPRIRVSGKSVTRLGWSAQSGSAGSGVSYDVVSGTLSRLHADHGFSGACTLASILASTATADPRAVPAGDGYYYLARAGNACGAGTFGEGWGVPDPRDAIDAALPTPCPD